MSEDRRLPRQPGRERGFALIVALLALLLLTFLGLTLAALTSGELQIATNYRWTQQALYNAEAGAQAARLMLRDVDDWSTVLPPARPGTWTIGTGTAFTAPTAPTWAASVPSCSTSVTTGCVRNWESQQCDSRGGGVGYGAVLGNPVVTGLGSAWQFISEPVVGGVTFPRLNGAVTVWVRRATVEGAGGVLSDDPENLRLILTAEGIAPYTALGTAFERANVAVRTIEVPLRRVPGEDDSCREPGEQAGGGSSGAGFYGCGALNGADSTGRLTAKGGGTGAGL